MLKIVSTCAIIVLPDEQNAVLQATLRCVCKVCLCVHVCKNSVRSCKPLSTRHAKQKPCNSNESTSSFEGPRTDKLQMEGKTKDSN